MVSPLTSCRGAKGHQESCALGACLTCAAMEGVTPGVRGYILLPVNTKAVWKASLEGAGLECSYWRCSGLIYVWTMPGFEQLYLLSLLVLVFKRILQVKKVTCAVFWNKWKKKVPSS